MSTHIALAEHNHDNHQSLLPFQLHHQSSVGFCFSDPSQLTTYPTLLIRELRAWLGLKHNYFGTSYRFHSFYISMVGAPRVLLTVPLDDRSNGASPTNILSPSASPLIYPHSTGKTIRRIDSVRRIGVSSESDSLEDANGIYNASPVDSEIDLPDTNTSPSQYDSKEVFSPQPIRPADGSISRSISLPLSPRSPPLGHSQWPAPHLDTILEHHSTLRSLRRPSSGPRLRLSPEMIPKLVKIKNSIHSIRPTRGIQRPPGADTGHQRSFSLNDLDCIEDCVRHHQERSACTSASCTSSEALDAVAEGPSYPIKPVNAPPDRAPTPPGLPKFGSRDAQVIRLLPAKQRQRPRLFPSWLVHSPDESEARSIEAPTQVMSPTSTSIPEDQVASPSESLLRRILAATGMSRHVSAPSQDQNESPRVSLPSGVFTTAEPGILAMADDGTAVRGRFGNRASGHGVGSRDITNHPLLRMGQISTVEEEVRQIDKACEELNRGPEPAHLQRLPTVPYASIDAELHRRLSDAERSSTQQPASGPDD